MTTTLGDTLGRDLERLAKRLNNYVGSVAIGSDKNNIYLMVSHIDYLLLRQSYFHAMNRSSRRRLREKLFGKVDYAKVSERTICGISESGETDADRPFLHMIFNRSCGSKYAVLKVENVRHMEYLLYVRQSAFRELVYRTQ